MSFVQDISASSAVASGTTISQTITGVTAGNLLRVVVMFKNSVTNTVTVSDGTSYTNAMAFFDGSSNWGLSEFYLLAAPGGSHTITATFSVGTVDQFIYIQERSNCTGFDIAGTVLNSVPGASGANVVLSNAVTTTHTDDVCGFGVCVTGSVTPSTGTTLAWVGRTANPWPTQGSNGAMGSEDLLAQTAGSYTATFGISSAGDRFFAYVIGYSNPGSGGGTATIAWVT
jgi:hypothetical protein